MTDFARLVLATDTTGLKKGRDELGRFVKAGADTERRTRQSTDRMGRNFTALGQTAAASVGTIIGRLVALSAATIGVGQVGRTLADFGTSMSQVQAITRATDAEMMQLRETAKGLGETTEFSAAQAADGLRFLGMAGFTAAEGMQAIPAVLDLATASGLGLAQSADIASNVLSGFGMQAGEAANVADVLAAASSRANTNVTQLGGAMSTAAPIAASLGIDLETTAAAIGVMSDAGIQGERAGTALRGVLAALAGPTKQAREAIAAYGLTAADVNPETNDLADVFALLRQRGLSTADAMTIFGREAASGALVLVEGNARFAEFGDELRNVDGAARDMATTMRDNLGGDLRGLMSAVQGLIIGLGDSGLTSALRSSVQAATDLVRAISGNLEPALKTLGVTLAFVAGAQIPGMVAATAKMVQSLGVAVSTTGALTAGMRALGVAVAIAGGPWSILIGAVSAAASAFLIFDTNAGTAEQAAYDAAAGTDALNGALDTFYETTAPSAAAKAIDLANANVKLADSAFEAAKAELAKERALLSTRNSAGANGSTGSIRSTGITATDNTVAAAEGRLAAAEKALAQAMRDRSRASEEIVMNTPVQIDQANQLNRTLDINIDTTSDLSDKLSGLGAAGSKVEDGLSDADKALRDLDGSSQRARSSFEQAFSSMISGASSASDALNQLLDSLVNILAQDLTGSIFDGLGGGSSGGILGGVISSIFGPGVTRAPAGGGLTVNTPNLLPPSFEGGGYTGSGPRSGGVDGRGGIWGILHPNETVIDHTKGQGLGGNVTNNIQVIAPPGSEVKQESSRNSTGGEDIKIMIDQAVSQLASDPGSNISRTLGTNFGIRPTTRGR